MRSTSLALLAFVFLLIACSSEPPSGPSLGPPVPLHREIPGARFPPPSVACEERVSFARNASTGEEAGFLATPSSRLFYAYQPHTGDDPDAPLAVFFNGGPGAPTTPYLFAGGTSARAVVWQHEALAAPADNPASWTRFAHLLYLDAPGMGYSYFTRTSLPNDDLSTDAVQFLDATISFLDCRMDRPDRPVVLVGESFGGLRAQLLLWHLHHPGERGVISAPFERAPRWPDADRHALEERIRDHFDRVAIGRGESEDAPWSQRVARQFFAQVLIQPLVMPIPEYPIAQQNTAAAQRRLEEPLGVSELALHVTHRGVAAIVDRDESRALLGVALEDIPWMAPSARPSEPTRNPEHPDIEPLPPSPHYLDDVLGALPEGGRYFHELGTTRHPLVASELPDDPLIGLAWTSTLVTDAANDRVIITPALPELLEGAGFVTRGVLRDDAHFELELQDGTSRLLALPRFDAGHIVSMHTPIELASEVESFLARARAERPAH